MKCSYCGLENGHAATCLWTAQPGEHGPTYGNSPRGRLLANWKEETVAMSSDRAAKHLAHIARIEAGESGIEPEPPVTDEGPLDTSNWSMEEYNSGSLIFPHPTA